MKRALLASLLAPLAYGQEGPPSRDLLLELTATSRLAGTATSYRAVEVVSSVLEEAGWRVEIDSREVLLSLPRRMELFAYEDSLGRVPVLERIVRFDPDAIPPGDLPPFNAWTASGEVRAEVVDAGWGLAEDFERLKDARIDVTGRIALCRYGRCYRGDKVRRAEEAGCAAVLLFTPAGDDGPERGPTWPQGPWMPTYEAQRGSVGPMGPGPGDPLTPGAPSPRPDPSGMPGTTPGQLAAALERLPKIPVMPIGSGEAGALLQRLSTRRIRDREGKVQSVRLGPGPVSVSVFIDAPRDRRQIHNVIGHLPGKRSSYVLAGNHRDAWVRGAHDAASGTVSLLRAAQHLGERRRTGWTPEFGIKLAFWDAEEFGLLGSTEWAEAQARELQERCLAYVNGDAVVSGLKFHASGAPGLESVLARALAQVPEPAELAISSEPVGEEPGTLVSSGEQGSLSGRSLLDQWRGSDPGRLPPFALPGSGSDYTVFLHHLGIPIVDLGFSGRPGGHYHTAFDDFSFVERYLDPGFVGHETAGQLFTALLVEIAALGPLSFDDIYAAGELERHAREAASWLGEERSLRLAQALEGLGRSISLSWEEWSGSVNLLAGEQGPLSSWALLLEALDDPVNVAAREAALGEVRPALYRSLARDAGIEGRPWFRNVLWAPDTENGYGSTAFPRLRAASEAGDLAALEARTAELCGRIEALRSSWDARSEAARSARRR